MSILYLDCAMGAAGDMLTAALLELFDDPEKELAELNSLETLIFDYNEVKELPKWDKNCSLTIIQGNHNKIASVEPLSGLVNLNYVILEYNSLTKVDALANCHTLIQVNVFGNKIKDVSKLTDAGIIVNYSPV